MIGRGPHDLLIQRIGVQDRNAKLRELKFLKWSVSKLTFCSRRRHYRYPRLFIIQTNLKIESRAKAVSASVHKTYRNMRDPGRLVS